MNPLGSYELRATDELVMMRPTNISARNFRPLPIPMPSSSRVTEWNTPSEEEVTRIEQAALLTDMTMADDASTTPSSMAGSCKMDEASHETVSIASLTNSIAEALRTSSSKSSSSRSSGSESDGSGAGTDGSTSKNGSSLSSSSHDFDAMYYIPNQYISTAASIKPVNVLICGWGRSNFMVDVIREMDHGLAMLPKGSEVTVFCDHEYDVSLGVLHDRIRIQNLTLHHVRGNPVSLNELARLDISHFQCCVIFADEKWIDPDQNANNGIEVSEPREVWRFDSLVMMVQLNVRKLLEEKALPPLHIISEKLGFEGVTRFEDRYRLPLGVNVNMQSYAAKLMTEMAYDPNILAPLQRFGRTEDMIVEDSGILARPGELLTYDDLIGRAIKMHQSLMGFFQIPTSVDRAIELEINPTLPELRNEPRVWNKGDGRTKFIVICDKDNVVLRSVAKVSLFRDETTRVEQVENGDVAKARPRATIPTPRVSSIPGVSAREPQRVSQRRDPVKSFVSAMNASSRQSAIPLSPVERTTTRPDAPSSRWQPPPPPDYSMKRRTLRQAAEQIETEAATISRRRRRFVNDDLDAPSMSSVSEITTILPENHHRIMSESSMGSVDSGSGSSGGDADYAAEAAAATARAEHKPPPASTTTTTTTTVLPGGQVVLSDTNAAKELLDANTLNHMMESFEEAMMGSGDKNGSKQKKPPPRRPKNGNSSRRKP